MKKLLHAVLGLCLSLGIYSTGLAADAVELGLTTGSPAGTYYRFGEDIAKLAEQNNIQITVQSSRGSIENIFSIYDSRSIQLGIAQSDVLLFLNLLGDEKQQAIAREIKVVFPLYDEEIHLVAKNDIQRFADLAGKRVAIGRPGSGTAMTASVLFSVTEVAPAEMIEIGLEEAIAALRAGEVDAMFLVAGQPVKLFQDGLSRDDGVHLVPITEAALLDMFGGGSQIPAGTYPWQNDSVMTVTVKAGLMTLDYPADAPECGHIKQLALLIRDNLGWLRQHGHAKWQNVNFDDPVSDSLRSPCAG